jgi:hypothetical protein
MSKTKGRRFVDNFLRGQSRRNDAAQYERRNMVMMRHFARTGKVSKGRPKIHP